MCQWLSRPPGEWIGQSRTRWIFARRPELRTCSSYKYLDLRTQGVLERYSRYSRCKHLDPRVTEASSIPATTWEVFTAGTSLDGPRACAARGAYTTAPRTLGVLSGQPGVRVSAVRRLPSSHGSARLSISAYAVGTHGGTPWVL
jgi:hypothetical protein